MRRWGEGEEAREGRGGRTGPMSGWRSYLVPIRIDPGLIVIRKGAWDIREGSNTVLSRVEGPGAYKRLTPLHNAPIPLCIRPKVIDMLCSSSAPLNCSLFADEENRCVERKAGNDVGQTVSIANRSGPVSGTGQYLSTKSRSPFPSLSILSAAHLSTPPSRPRRLSSRRAPSPPLRHFVFDP